MTEKIESLRMKLEVYAVYRIFQKIHEWVTTCLFDGYLRIIPIVLGFVAWPLMSLYFFAKGRIDGGIVALLIYATYWIHILLFED